MKLDGISYHDNELRVEDTTSTRKRPSNNTLNESRRPSVVVNYYPEKQHSHGRKCSPSESKFSKRKKQIAIFGESIPRGIRLREFNYWLLCSVEIVSWWCHRADFRFLVPEFSGERFCPFVI